MAQKQITALNETLICTPFRQNNNCPHQFNTTQRSNKISKRKKITQSQKKNHQILVSSKNSRTFASLLRARAKRRVRLGVRTRPFHG